MAQVTEERATLVTGLLFGVMYTIWNMNLFLLLRLILRVVHLELYGAFFFHIFIRYAAFPVAFIINLLQFP